MQVLLVDDVTDTGDTLRLAIEHMQSHNPAQLKVAVLQHKQVSPLEPDFYAQKIVAWRWVIYPWALELISQGRFGTDESGALYFDDKPAPDGIEIKDQGGIENYEL